MIRWLKHNAAKARASEGRRTKTQPHAAVLPLLSWRALIPVLALLVFGTLFLRHLSTLDPKLIWAAFADLAVWQWALAALFTALSFRAIGTYDVLVHTVLGTGQSKRRARRAGVKAIAVSQTIGFGAVTSGLVRWQCLPDLPTSMILRLSATVSLSFLVGLAAVAGFVIPFTSIVPLTWPFASVGILAVVLLWVLGRLAFRAGWIPARLRNRTLGALLAATFADTAFAAAALWVLWPDAIGFDVLFAAYLLALGAGLVSNSPGGVGAFDLTLLALVPISDDAAAMAALLAFRVTYYLLPAGIALVAMLLAGQGSSGPHGSGKPLEHPEAALATQNAKIHDHPKASMLVLPCIGAGAVLGNLPRQMDIDDLNGPHPKVLYKCDAAHAGRSRRAGWAVLRCARDAVVDLQYWSLDGSARRQLRRALRSFESSGHSVREVRQFDDLAPIARDWAKSHGGERGLSMGQFCPDYLRHQRVFVGFNGARPVAFVSFHHTGDQWTLDLVRHRSDVPQGTMHALVCAGIFAAQAAGATHVSLAAVPAPAPNFPFARKILRDAEGLARFKTSFAPDWQPRYICARTHPLLFSAIATLALGILYPPARFGKSAQADPNNVHTEHEQNSFVPTPRACEPLVTPDGAFSDDKRPI